MTRIKVKRPYITSVEKIGYRRGHQTGHLEGHQKGWREGYQKGWQEGQGHQHEKILVARLIARKFKSQPELELVRLEKLIADDLLELGELLFDLETLDAVHAWIVKRSENH